MHAHKAFLRPVPFCLPAPEPISGRFAEVLRPLPKPFDTYEQQYVYRHLDLADMTGEQLRTEESAVAARIAYETRCDAWFIERLARLRSLLRPGAMTTPARPTTDTSANGGVA